MDYDVSAHNYVTDGAEQVAISHDGSGLLLALDVRLVFQ